MENNKAYLQKMPWVFLLGILNTAAVYLIYPWLYDPSKGYTAPGMLENIAYLLLPSMIYVSLGIITSKWKEAAIAYAVFLVINSVYIFVFTPNGASTDAVIKFTLTTRLIMFFIYPIPIFVFIVLQTGLVKRLWMLYPIIFFLFLAFSLDSYTTQSMQPVAYFFSSDMRDIALAIFSFLVKVAFFVIEVLAVCEMVNIGNGKTYTNKPTLLNLGNEYDSKLSNILTFWALKLCLLMVILGSAAAFTQILQLMERDSYFTGNNADLRKYFIYTSFFSAVSFACLAIFIAWYIRKFLLEVFVSYGIHSKFLYWFSFLPLLGFFGFLVVQLENIKHEKYNQKVSSIGTFAASSTAGVTGIIFFFLGVRLIMQMVAGDPAYIVSVIISGALFVWLMASTTGYQVSIWLAGVGLFFMILIGLLSKTTSSSTQETYGLMYALILANLVSLIFIYPVYHFEEFQYMPSEDPQPIAPGDPEFSLFP
jgi:hypothetical protein